MRASFEQYSGAYDHVRMERTDGIVELTLHTDGGSLVWGDGPHTELGYCFADVGCDPENRVVILTGAGDDFLAALDTSWVGAMNPDKWSKIYFHGRRLLLNLLEMEMPVIAAVNGPATVHAELALLSDIVLASDTAVFADSPHFRFGTVPGDGVHAIWPALFGPNRGRHLLLTAQKVPAAEALALGVVAEVMPAADLRDRAWELARSLAKKPPNVLRYTRSVLTARWRAELGAALDHGLAMEGLGAYESWPSG